MEISFGKYKGQDLSEIPFDYLEWLQGEGIKSPKLREAVQKELQRRAESGEPSDPAPATVPSKTTERDPVAVALEKVEQARLLLRAALGGR